MPRGATGATQLDAPHGAAGELDASYLAETRGAVVSTGLTWSTGEMLLKGFIFGLQRITGSPPGEYRVILEDQVMLGKWGRCDIAHGCRAHP